MKNNLFEFLKSVNEEKAIIEKKPDDNYHVVYKKRLLSNDGSDVGWLYVDVPNARLNDDNVYIIEPIMVFHIHQIAQNVVNLKERNDNHVCTL